MHFERVGVGAIVDVRTCNFTNKASQEKKPNQKSSNYGILLPHSLKCVCEGGQRISSEVSNIFSVSSHKLFPEITESQADIRVSDLCEDSRKARLGGERSDTPKGLITSDNDRFSNQLEKHKELDILVNNVSCIRGSDSTYLTIDVNENHHDIQNFTENPPLKGVVYPSSFNCAIPQKRECFECLGEQEESTPARVAISGFNGQIDGVYSYSTCRKDHPHLNTEDSAIETELHLYFKKHFQKCPAVIENTSMKGQPQPVDMMDLSNSMEEEVRVCDICGDVGLEELLAICSKCTDGAEHIYCMRIKLDKVPEGEWTCEECILRTDAKKPAQDKVKETTGKSIGHPQSQIFGSSVNIESRSGSKMKTRSACAGGKGANDVNSIPLFPAKRCGALPQAQSVKRAKTTAVRAVLPRSSKPCSNSLLHQKTSFKNLKEAKETKEISSGQQLSCNASEKAKVPIACSDQRCVETLNAESDRQTRDLESEVIFPEKFNRNKSLLQRDTLFNLKKGQMKVSKRTASEPQISCNAQEKAEVPSASGDERHLASLKAELDKMKGDLETKVKSPKESETIDNPALHSNPSFKDLKKRKMKPSKEITSVLQISCNAQRKANVPIYSGDDKRRDIVKEVISSKASQPINYFILRREASFENLEKKAVIAQNVSSLKKSSYGTQAKALLSSILGDKSPKSCSQPEILQDECSLLKSGLSNTTDLKLKGQLPEGSPLKSRSSNAADLKLKGELTKDGSLPNLRVVRNRNFQDKKGQKDPRVLSKSLSFDNVSFDKLDTPGSEVLPPNADRSEVLKKLHPSSNITHKPASVEESYGRNLPQFESAFFSQAFVMPEPDYIWLGKFQLYGREGLESSCDGIQAHLSAFASTKVLEAVDKLPEIIVLEQLSRLRTWPSQFAERRATEENIALYFFATDLDRTYYTRLLECMTKNDLVLRGYLDGVELLIFPSNLLPEESQRWDSLLFLWGVFRGRKVGNSVPPSDSLKVKNRYSEKILSLDLNADPQEGEDTRGVDEGGKCWSFNDSPCEIHTFDSPGVNSSADAVFLGGDGYTSESTGVMRATDKGEVKSPYVDLDLSLWTKSDGVVGDNRNNNEEVHEEATMEDVEASFSGSNGPNLETEEGMKELMLEWQAADILILLSKGFGGR